MFDKDNPLSPEFIERQRKRLETLRDQHLATRTEENTQERTMQEERGAEAQEFEEQAQDMAQNEVQQALQDADQQRLSRIGRALQKVAEGTYGLSDLSGDPIPQARLDSVPEAIFTIEEERQAQKGSRSSP